MGVVSKRAKGDLTKVELRGDEIVIKLVKEKALRKLLVVMDRVHEKNKGVSEEEVAKYATQAIAQLREEEYAKQRKL